MSFDHRSAGTSEAAWRKAGLESLQTVTAAAGRLVVLAAHPDDESLGAGGLLAASAAAGADIQVIIASDGEASHPASHTYTPADLQVRRRDEVRRAVAHLAPRAAIHHLGLPDGRLTSHAADLDAALATLVGSAGARLVTPWRDDRHPDHQACAEAAARYVEQFPHIEHWQYPIWLWHWADPSEGLPARLRRLDLTDAERAAKAAALVEHGSQHTALSARAGDEAILSASMLAHFDRPYECFIVETAPAARPSYFDELYAQSDDPWGLAERYYEQRKRNLVLAALPRQRFRRGFEPGCATGLLTEQLVHRVDEVIAWDAAGAAVDQTTARFVALPPSRVSVHRRQIPSDWPDGLFDLIVLSEVGYYCTDIDLLVRRAVESLQPDGVIVACHWRHAAEDHPRTANDVHDAFDRVLIRGVHHLEDDFRLDIWSRSGFSVATADGIV